MTIIIIITDKRNNGGKCSISRKQDVKCNVTSSFHPSNQVFCAKIIFITTTSLISAILLFVAIFNSHFIVTCLPAAHGKVGEDSRQWTCHLITVCELNVLCNLRATTLVIAVVALRDAMHSDRSYYALQGTAVML